MQSKRIAGVLLGVFTLGIYFWWQTKSIYGGDAGDLVTAAYVKGVAHPPGYPLYTFLGYLLTRLPYSTVAARVGLLSVIPSALTIVVLFFLIFKITDRLIPALIASLTLAFSYLFWLYAEVPEVFGLHSLFVVVLTYLLFLWSERAKQAKYHSSRHPELVSGSKRLGFRNKFGMTFTSKPHRLLYLFSFIFGLSLCHHHIILFLVPAFAYWIYTHKKYLPRLSFSLFTFHFSLFTLGLLPYLYVYFAAKAQPPLSWCNPVNLKNFIRLITRADYGTFVSNFLFSRGFFTRFVQLLAFVETLKIDFTRFGILLILLGAIHQFRKSRRLFLFVSLAITFSGLFFVFYASFPLISNFMLGTFERFLLPSYLFLTIWLAEGILFLSNLFNKVILNLFQNLYKFCHSNPPADGEESHRLLVLGGGSSGFALRMTSVIFFLLPFSLFYANFPKISILKNDFTAEHLGEDILNPLPKNSVLFLSGDTPGFNTQYVYFAQEKRKDIMMIHFGRLGDLEYQKQIKRFYPQFKIAEEEDDEKTFFSFVKLNYPRFPIYANVSTGIPEDYVWVPEGLVKKFYLRKEAPPGKDFLAKSQEIWGKYHDPLQGGLSKYKNLMLADVLRVYGWARQDTGKVLFNANFFSEAEEYFQEAIKLVPEERENYQLLGEAFLSQGKCYAAKKSFEHAVAMDEQDEHGYLFLSQTYKECFKNNEKAQEYERIYEELKREREIPIEKL